ncbi:MAG: hypothetical protein A2X61_08425 [Ignavibacteria bacterium GWB2_35_12]|nr:MAG: hypothetical protein A2X63_02315 [Ignavibacteria bacterium GWA2_35_8]OGU40181.1 MAG: hypothetical protein A2X61_08425 [Ignavibacteria bacterium GWB2_35_12]OGU92375.1 MAG: hypothetical protein A2220_16870 [Ignavibacteria bacterium RIFOXYA2_FULL_35_10]OGV22336.1 MAG: hypothetical protein A2475_15710 [Ignavibacteria bacterium RIFOXYC2_FULL_35_21]
MLKQYPKYKPSGNDLIGDIPEHWNIKKLKFLLKPIKGSLKPGPFGSDLKNSDFSTIGEIKVYTQRNIIENNFELGEDYISNEKFNKLSVFEIFENDIIITSRGTIGKASKFPKGVQRGIIHPCLIKLQINTDKISNDFLIKYFNDAVFFKEDVKISSNSTVIDVIYGNTLKEINIFVPPIDEQIKIVEFINKKTALIDSFIEKKQKLIELLKEERTAVINQAVTKGLPSPSGEGQGVRFKPSGIDWLGDIPEHWEVKKLKYVAEIQSSNVDKKTNEGEISVLLCNYIDVYKNEFINDSILFMEASATEKEIEKFILNKGDVLITKDSETPDDIAKPAYVEKDFENVICGYHLAQIKTNRHDMFGEYLFRLFQSKDFNSHFEVSANGVTRFGLPLDSITDVIVPLPLKAEQKQIVNHIENETQKIDSTITKIEKEIELMQEYRTALISEVVTGKVKVV